MKEESFSRKKEDTKKLLKQALSPGVKRLTRFLSKFKGDVIYMAIVDSVVSFRLED